MLYKCTKFKNTTTKTNISYSRKSSSRSYKKLDLLQLRKLPSARVFLKSISTYFENEFNERATISHNTLAKDRSNKQPVEHLEKTIKIK